jgi:hypothetical protein
MPRAVGLEKNMKIDAINASNNSIVRISHLAHLGGTLNTLGLAHNKLVSSL